MKDRNISASPKKKKKKERKIEIYLSNHNKIYLLAVLVDPSSEWGIKILTIDREK